MRRTLKLTNRKFINVLQRAYATDRPYSTVIGILPDSFEHNEAVEDIKPYSAVPGPKELPIIGNAWRFAPLIGHFKIHELDKVMWSLYKDYGKIVKVGGLIGHPDLLFVFDGDIIERVFRFEERMPHRPSMPSLHYYKQQLREAFFGETPGAVGVHGPKWDAFRKQVQHIVLRPTVARRYVQPLDEIAADFLKRMEASLDENKELPENFMGEINKWALECVARVSLDTRLGCLEPNLSPESQTQQIINSIHTFFRNVPEVELKFPVWRLFHNRNFREYIRALESFRILCFEYIAKAMQEKDNTERQETEENLSIVQVILKRTKNPKLAAALALDFFLVGVDTTSIAVASTMYHLAQHQDKQQVLFKELKNVLPEPDTPITVSSLEAASYVKSCLKETLRLKPVVLGNGRTLQSDAVIGGYEVPKGTHVIFPHLVVGNIEKYFNQSDKFVPERWLKSSEECPFSQNKIHPFVSLPFGYGRRACLGRRFAEAELHILLAKIFRKYRVEYNYGPMTYKVMPSFTPMGPLKFKLTPRI